MKLEDRIKNIKSILKFCVNNKVEIYNETCINYFTKFFKNHSKFPDAFTGIITIGNFLESVAINPTLMIQYCYKEGVGEYDEQLILFIDPEEEYQNWPWDNEGELNYSEIDDDIWKIIEEESYKSAKKNVEDEFENIKSTIEYYTKLKNDFESLILVKD